MAHAMKRTLYFSIILIGFTAMASQIIFMREFLIVFYGNELSISFILANWLMGGAIGSLVLGRLADRLKYKEIVFSTCQIALSALLPLNIFAIRSVKTFLNINPGEIMPFSSMMISSFIILGPICMILGFLFSLACRIYGSEERSGATGIGKVYILEAIGSMGGGFLVSFMLISVLGSLEIMAIFAILNLLLAISLLMHADKVKIRSVLTATAGAIFIGMLAMRAFDTWQRLDEGSMARQWRGYSLISAKNSIYGNIAIVKRGEEFSFFDNGLHLYTIPDEMISEESVHFALLEDPHPEDVLLIGGGVGGLMGELLKHPVKSVDYVELDPLLIKMARDNIPAEYYAPLADRRVSIKNIDGRLFIKTADKKYDCIIVHVGDPHTAQTNRYYTLEFFKEISGILKDDGLLSFAVASSENYINEELADFLRSIYATLAKVFSDIKVLPGPTAYFLASNETGFLTYDYRILMERADERGLKIKYVREYYLFSRLSPERVSYIEEIVKEGRHIRINRDFRPISYYYDIIFWASQFRDSALSRILKITTEKRIWQTICTLYAAILLAGLAGIRREKHYRGLVLTAVAAAGFSSISFQIVILLSFQIIYGYLFYKLGLILTSFMIGLALGGWWLLRVIPKVRNDRTVFAFAQGAFCIYPLLLPLFFWRFAGLKNAYLSWFGSNLLFLFLPIIAGFMGGFQFTLANKLYLRKDEGVGRVSGLNYGIDLLGSSLGAILTGTFLIPILGIPGTCFAAAGLNFVVLVTLMVSGGQGRSR